MRGKFCVSCGRIDLPLVDGKLCPECYAKHRDLVEAPKEVRGKLCKLCGAMWISGRWVKPTTDDPFREYVWKLVVPKLKVDPNVKGFEVTLERTWRDVGNRTYATVLIVGDISGYRFEARKDVLLDVAKTLCDDCMRKKTGYYEAKIQLRFKEGRMEEGKRQFFESFFNRSALNSLTNVVEGVEGVDYYLASKSVAKSLIVNFLSVYPEAEVKETFENEKVKDGKKTAKLVISIRL
ncbi:MAG: 60S ribosomal export protein NMD3 [Thermoprotei archaeon]